jgi:hypothetical protein
VAFEQTPDDVDGETRSELNSFLQLSFLPLSTLHRSIAAHCIGANINCATRKKVDEVLTWRETINSSSASISTCLSSATSIIDDSDRWNNFVTVYDVVLVILWHFHAL